MDAVIGRKRRGEQVAVVTPEDMDRIIRVLNSLERSQPSAFGWSRSDFLEVWLIEHRMDAERRASWRLTFATWVLVLATVVLVIATFVLAHVTAVHI